MKRIYKSAEPEALLDWKAGKNWQGNPPPWEELSTQASAAVRATTSTEQCELCCYCTGSIEGGDFHIEHFRPQNPFINLRFAWPNLLASCQSYLKGSFDGTPVETQLHCGHRKGNWFVQGITIDPQAADIESKFRYPLSGRVFPSKSLTGLAYDAVQDTIDHLNLNAPALVLRREAILRLAGRDTDTLSRSDWLATYAPAPATPNPLPEFWPALRYNYQVHWTKLFP